MITSTEKKAEYTPVRNACKLCSPLGASLMFKGIKGAVALLHGSQGCSTYIRRYLISHFKEPIDIACSNFAEETAIFGGGVNFKLALDNIRLQYEPTLVGVTTTCLSETIGDDVNMFIKEYERLYQNEELPPIIHASTPSYSGTHMTGFHKAVMSTVETLATGDKVSDKKKKTKTEHVNIFPGMLSPADLRHLKEIFNDFSIPCIMLPDYSQTLDGPLWKEYHRIPEGGTSVSDIKKTGSALASVEFGRALSFAKQSSGKFLDRKFNIPCFNTGIPIGVYETDFLLNTLKKITGLPIPEKYKEERGRLIDSYVDAHKYLMGAKAVIYGEEDLVIGIAAFLNEIGVVPVVCASGDKSGFLKKSISEIIPDYKDKNINIIESADFVDIETIARELKPDIFIGHSKGYSITRRLKIPLIRIGFPIHDRIGGSRIMHIGYRGTQQLFDRIANTLIEIRQDKSPVGYTYM